MDNILDIRTCGRRSHEDLAAGGLVGLGLALLLWRLLPAEPDLADVLTRLSPQRPRGPDDEDRSPGLGPVG